MKVLVINCGSSSLKYQLINTDTDEVFAKGLCERIGIDGSQIVYQKEGCQKEKTLTPMPTHKEAIGLVLEYLMNEETGVVKSLDEIDAIGHRIVHGGEKFTESVLITDEVIEAIEECSELAPLHNPANLTGIRVCQMLMPGIPMVAVFDTAFHQTMPEKAYLYGIPYKYYENYSIRRYGFHGTSHKYVSNHMAHFLKTRLKYLKVIVCHLGNGASISAIDHGKCIDTSMGMTPLEGLMMGTRSGDIDPAILEYIQKKDNITIEEVMDILNKESGVYGMSGISSDFRDLTEAEEAGNQAAARTLEAYAYRVAKYIGSYVAAMNGVDAIAFTAGVGENSAVIRSEICKYLGYLGLTIDEVTNHAGSGDRIITTPDSRVRVCVIPTNEELEIARETMRLVKGGKAE